MPTLFLHGKVGAKRRTEMVDAFQSGQAPVLLLSLKAGGVGLNLTRATHVVHYDRWWNPAVEDQATDRAHRIGQDRPVQVHRLIAEGTLEDHIAALIERKRSLAEAVVGGGESWIGRLTDAGARRPGPPGERRMSPAGRRLVRAQAATARAERAARGRVAVPSAPPGGAGPGWRRSSSGPGSIRTGCPGGGPTPGPARSGR